MAEQYVTDKFLAQRFAVRRATVWEWARTGNFPKPVKLSAQCSRWRLSDVESWEERRASEVA